MSGSTAEPLPMRPPSAAAAVFGRFVWKEYRLLRAFWLALAALAVGMQVVLLPLAPREEPAVTWLFAVAWGAAALYAFGAAATLFATEHEEETHGFLAGLPATWPPLFLGKLTVAVVSTGAVAAVVLLTGFILGGRRWPAAREAGDVLAVLAPAVVEGLAWGTLFSLTLRRPLLAAVLAIAAAAASVCWLNSIVGPRSMGLLFTAAYRSSVGARLALAGGVFLVDVFLARRWLTSGSVVTAPLLDRLCRGRSLAAPADSVLVERRTTAAKARLGRIAQLRTLLWQTWRESWSTMAILIVLAVPFAIPWPWIVVTTQFPRRPTAHGPELEVRLLALSLMIPAALAGACVFLADQRRQQYRFLAEHAARPRYVWLARHVIWLGAGVAVAAIVVVVGCVMGVAQFVQELPNMSLPWDSPQSDYGFSRDMLREMVEVFLRLTHLHMGLGCAIVSAYAAGQLASMTVRSGILAGFLAMVLSLLLGVWIAIVEAWELSELRFVLPIAAGMFFATWLRAPDWILQRATPRAWWKPCAAILLPVIVVGTLVPGARVNQVPAYLDLVEAGTTRRKTLDEALALWHAADTPAARETARRYQRACDRMVDWNAIVQDVMFDARRRSAPSDEDRAAVRRRYLEANRDAVREAMEISKRPECRFAIAFVESPTSYRMFEVIALAGQMGRGALSRQELDRAFEYSLAELRMLGHVRSGLPACTWPNAAAFQGVLGQLAEWAGQEGQTSARLKRAITELDEVWATPPDPRTAVVGDYLLLREVIEGKRTPRYLGGWQRRMPDDVDPLSRIVMPIVSYLPYLANQLPWERERALRVLDLVTVESLHSVGSLGIYLSGGCPVAHRVRDLLEQARLADGIAGHRSLWRLPTAWRLLQTSYLLRDEYYAPWGRMSGFLQGIADVTTRQRGLKLQLALIACRLDHGDYPKELEALVPEYLDQLPSDPYGEGTFRYEGEGFDRRLLGFGPFWALGPDWFERSIPAHEPVLWSPGPRNAVVRPVRVDKRGRQVLERAVNQPSPVGDTEPGEIVYKLEPLEALVFPLPRRESPEAP